MSSYPMTRPDGRSGPPGFTLVEVVWVLAIIGLVTALAMPRVDVGRVAADAGALEVGSILLVAQRTAVMRQHDVRVVFVEDENALRLHYDEDNDGTVDAGERYQLRELPDRAAFGNASSYLGGSAVVSFEEDDEGHSVVTYRRNGSASEEGVVHITSRAASASTDDRAVRVERATGLARCWSRRSGSWAEGC